MTEAELARLNILRLELERSRGTQTSYINKAFYLLLASVLAIAWCCISLKVIGFVIAPFLIVTAAFQTFIFLKMADFERRYSLRLETQLNKWMGESLLSRGVFEEEFFMPRGGQASANSLPNLFKGFVLHYAILGALALFWSWYNIFQTAPQYSMSFSALTYLAAFVIWTTVNLTYLFWYFLHHPAPTVIDATRQIPVVTSAPGSSSSS